MIRNRNGGEIMRPTMRTDQDGAGAMIPVPELEIFQPVVMPVPILVVDGLGRTQGSTQGLGHDQPVLQDVSPLVSIGVARTQHLGVVPMQDALYPRAAMTGQKAVGPSLVVALCADRSRGRGYGSSASALTQAGPRPDAIGDMWCSRDGHEMRVSR